MIARELTEFFAGFSAGRRAGASSAPATRRSSRTSTPATRAPAGRRSASARSPTPRTRRSAPTCWRPAGRRSTSRGAAVLHAHDYGAIEFMRRYFDEYRGLRESTGHVEPFACSAPLATCARQVAADRRWMAEQGLGGAERARWTARAAVHHGGRRVVLGARLARRAAARAAAPAPLAGGRDGGDRRRPGARRAPRPRARTARGRAPPGSPLAAAHARAAAAAPRRLRRGRARLARGPAPLLDPRARAWPSASACAWRW